MRIDHLALVCVRRHGLVLLLLLAAIGLGAGCGSSSSDGKNLQPGLPPPPSPGTLNSYVGTQTTLGFTATSDPIQVGVVWQATIDYGTNSYSDVNFVDDIPTNGLFAGIGQFVGFTQTNPPVNPPFQSAGFGLEIPSRAMLLRPDQIPGVLTSPTPLVALVAQSNCLNINGSVTFQFVTLPGSIWTVSTDTAFGSVHAATQGNTWNFSDLTQSSLVGLPPTNPAPQFSAGTCAQAPPGFVISVPTSPTVQFPITIAVGPSGFYVADQGTGNPGQVGVLQPAMPLGANSLLSANYFGFVYQPGLSGTFFDPNTGSPLPVTHPAKFVANSVVPNSDPNTNQHFPFECTNAPILLPSANSVCGGEYANDNPATGGLIVDTVIGFGPQDPANNGLYKSATVTFTYSPFDPSTPAMCRTDTDNTGFCTFPAVAVAGNPEDKMAVFLIAQDGRLFSNDGGFTFTVSTPLAIYLYQQ